MSDFMLRAIELAKKAEGKTSPNPLVGAVIVKDNQIIGEGFHRYAGSLHAEIEAINNTQAPLNGSKLYINLEPCCHFGKTPPCTTGIINSGISEVHMATLDPNPLVNGKGRSILEKAGIKTYVGACAEEAEKLNESFFYWINHRKPFVMAKFAMSMDGKIASRTGDSRWISSPSSREYVHQIRNKTDAILVGVNTIIADNPSLTTRIEGIKDVSHPIRIVLDTNGRTPTEAKIVSPDIPGKTIIVTNKKQHLKKISSSIEILELPTSPEGICLQSLITILGEKNICSLLVEGGGTILSSFYQQHLIHKTLAFIAPIIIGGKDAKTPVEGIGINYIKEAAQWKFSDVANFSGDVLLTSYLKRADDV